MNIWAVIIVAYSLMHCFNAALWRGQDVYVSNKSVAIEYAVAAVIIFSVLKLQGQ